MLTYGSAHVSVNFRALRGSAPSTGTRRIQKDAVCRSMYYKLQIKWRLWHSGGLEHVSCNNNFFSNAILGCKGNQVRTRKRSKQRIMSASNQSFLQIAPRRLATLVSRTSSHVRLHILHACCHRMKSSIFFCFSAATTCLARIFHTCLFLFIDGIYPSCCQAVGIVGS
jgi:hypothetical protein